MDKDKAAKDNKGQSKMHVMTNPATGETRTVTQADWRENHKEYLQQGFVRPEEVEDVPADSTSGTDTSGQ